MNSTTNAVFSSGAVRWWSFTLMTGQSVVIDTIGSTFDTEIGLYDSRGVFIDSDDDSAGSANASKLSRSLPAGTYYLLAGGFNMDFSGTNWGYTTSHTRSGTIVINTSITATYSYTPVPVTAIGGHYSVNASAVTVGWEGYDANSNNWPPLEGPSKAVDGDTGASSKFLLFNGSGAALIVTPQAGSTSIPINRVALWTANDFEGRDPANCSLYGSTTPLTNSSPGTSISLASLTYLGLMTAEMPAARNAPAPELVFTGHPAGQTAFASYVLVFETTKPDTADPAQEAGRTQVAEVQFSRAVPQQPEMAILGNGVTIVSGAATPDVSNHTDFGTTDTTSGTITRTFTIQNTGGGMLTLSGSPRVSIVGASASDFSVLVQPASPVAPAGSTTFQVVFDPTASGQRAAWVSIANNDSDENPYLFNMMGTGSASANADLGFLSFNQGALSPAFAPATTAYTAQDVRQGTGVTVTAQRSHAGAALAVRLNSGAYTTLTSGTPSAPMTLVSGANTISIRVTAENGTTQKVYTIAVNGVEPEIAITGAGQPLASGDTTPSTGDGTDMGAVAVTGGVTARSFNIQNTGTMPLLLNGSPRVSITGAHAADFSVSLLPADSIAPGGSSLMGISFDPTASGVRTATVTIANNDADENPFSFAIRGTGTLSSNADLNALSLNHGTLSPAFAAGTTAYTASGLTVAQSITVTASKAFTAATLAWRFNGGAYSPLNSGTASSAFSLPIGTSTIDVRVTAEDGTTQKTYSISAVVTAPALTVNFTSYNPAVTAANYSAAGGTAQFTLGFHPVPGSSLFVINNTGQEFITGEFSNLPNGAVITLNYAGVNYPYVAWYHGGDGNDLVLLWKNTALSAWGRNTAGALGDGTTNNRSVPSAVDMSGVLAGKTIVQTSRGAMHTLALTTEGKVYAWGGNGTGELGDGTTTMRTTPVAVDASGVLAGRRVIAVAAGVSHSVALTADGTVATWGRNEFGQLGDGTTTNRHVPVAAVSTGVLAGRRFRLVTAGFGHTVVGSNDGYLMAWGLNSDGQLGDGSTTQRLAPVIVGGVVRPWKSISAGWLHTVGVTADSSTLEVWGDNFYGQLGLNDFTDRLTPTPSVAHWQVVRAAAGPYQTFLFPADSGTVIYGCGIGSQGEMGNGSQANTNSTFTASSAVNRSSDSLLAIAETGAMIIPSAFQASLKSWGLNQYGEAGDGTASQRLTPVDVATAGTVLAGKTFLVPGQGVGSHQIVTYGTSAANPSGADKAIAVSAGQIYTFTAADWGFTFGNSSATAFTGVRFTTLPGSGTLKVGGVNATASQVASIGGAAAAITWTAPANPGTYTFTFQVQDNGASNNEDLSPNTITFTVTGPGTPVIVDDFDNAALGTNPNGTGTGFTNYGQHAVSESGGMVNMSTAINARTMVIASNDLVDPFQAGVNTTATFRFGNITYNSSWHRLWVGYRLSTSTSDHFTPDHDNIHGLYVSVISNSGSDALLGNLVARSTTGARTTLASWTWSNPAQLSNLEVTLTTSSSHYALNFSGAAATPAFVTGAASGALTGLGTIGANRYKAGVHNQTLAAATSGAVFVDSISVTGGLTDLEAWRLGNFGSAVGTGGTGNAGDFDGDGLSNLVEYAFGLNPAGGGSQALPLPLLAGGNYTVTFTGVSGVNYAAEWSSTLLPGSWTPVPNTGAGNTQTFTVPAGANSRMFFRYTVSPQ